ncbi:unnamed protein product [Caenorhabditis brenneri]
MFYAQFVLAKKGPLAKIWLAAHWEKKLTKAQIFETDVPQAIEEVIKPKVKMALRTVGHLLLGIVRIYSKKTRYLLADTNEAYLKMKVNFRDGFSFEADLPLNADIDENFINHADDFNISVPDFHDSDYNEQLIMANVSRLEDITIRDDVNYNAMFQINMDDDGFGDEGDYGTIEQLYGSLEPSSIRPTPQPESLEPDGSIQRVRDVSVQNSIVSMQGEGSVDLLEVERPAVQHDDKPFDSYGGGHTEGFDVNERKPEDLTIPEANEDHGPAPNPQMFNSMIHDNVYDDMDVGFEPEAEPRPRSPESFSLEPLDLENMEGGRRRRQRKPRRLMVDAETMISNEAFRAQQQDFTDLMQPIRMAPPSRKMLRMCVSGDLPHLMSLPGSSIHNKQLLSEYQRCLVPRKYDPNLTIAELSDSSSSVGSIERPAAPWVDLGLNEHIPIDVNEHAIEDDYHGYDNDVDFGGPMDMNATLGQIQDATDIDPVPIPVDQEENKENEDSEENWVDPFGSSASKSGRLEAYGFGSFVQKPTDDEGKWSKRANQILKQISASIESSGQAQFSSVTSSAKTRKQAAEQFYSLLTLAKSQAVLVEQEEPYGEISIRAGRNFQEALNPTASTSAGVLRTPMRAI